MNNFKIIIAGVGTIMWGPKGNMTRNLVFIELIHQDYSKGGQIPLPTPLKDNGNPNKETSNFLI